MVTDDGHKIWYISEERLREGSGICYTQGHNTLSCRMQTHLKQTDHHKDLQPNSRISRLYKSTRLRVQAHKRKLNSFTRNWNPPSKTLQRMMYILFVRKTLHSSLSYRETGMPRWGWIHIRTIQAQWRSLPGARQIIKEPGC